MKSITTKEIETNENDQLANKNIKNGIIMIDWTSWP